MYISDNFNHVIYLSDYRIYLGMKKKNFHSVSKCHFTHYQLIKEQILNFYVKLIIIKSKYEHSKFIGKKNNNNMGHTLPSLSESKWMNIWSKSSLILSFMISLVILNSQSRSESSTRRS